MKKTQSNNTKLIVGLALASLFMSGCLKSENTSSDRLGNVDFHYKIENSKLKNQKNTNFSWLNFPTMDDLEKCIKYLTYLDTAYAESHIAVFDSSSEYLSMRALTSTDYRDSIKVFDDVLASLINPDGIIQISGYIIQLNTAEGYAIIKDSSLKNRDVYLSLDNNFADYLDGSIASSKIKYSASDVVASRGRIDSFSITDTVYDKAEFHITCKEDVSNGLFYSSIIARIKRNTVIAGGTPELYVTTASGYYKLKNENRTYFNGQAKGGTNHRYTNYIYNGSKQVDRGGSDPYKLESDFHVTYAIYNGYDRFIHLPIFH